MNRPKTKHKTSDRSRHYDPHLPNPWKILLAQEFPGIPFKQALQLKRRQFEKVVREAVARQAERKARRARNKAAQLP